MTDRACEAGQTNRDASARESRSGSVAIVMPAHNEATRISACLDSLSSFRNAGDRLIVVDAASTDATASIASGLGVEVITSPSPRRAAAVRMGYEAVAQDVEAVLIAHADMRFPADARRRVQRFLMASPHAPGAFLGHTIDDRRWRFRIIETGNNLRAGYLGMPYGDQAMVIRTAAVRSSGGFPPVEALEDLELALRLRERGRWMDLRCRVTIDARHWDRGVVRTTLRNWQTVLKHRRRRQRAL